MVVYMKKKGEIGRRDYEMVSVIIEKRRTDIHTIKIMIFKNAS